MRGSFTPASVCPILATGCVWACADVPSWLRDGIRSDTSCSAAPSCGSTADYGPGSDGYRERSMRIASGTILMAVLMAVMVACSGSGPQAVTPVLAAAEPSPASAPPAAPAAPRDASFVASGPLLVENQVDLAAQRPGVVIKILADVGQSVRHGQLLASLDDRQLLAQRDAAQASLNSAQADLQDWRAETKVAEADFRRADAMYKAQLSTQEQLEHSRYKWEGSKFEVEKGKQTLLHAQASLQAASLELEKAHIRAPF